MGSNGRPALEELGYFLVAGIVALNSPSVGVVMFQRPDQERNVLVRNLHLHVAASCSHMDGSDTGTKSTLQRMPGDNVFNHTVLVAAVRVRRHDIVDQRAIGFEGDANPGRSIPKPNLG
jgi:hypothetical protein